MNSTILQLAAKYLKVIFLIFALIALLRGHNHPGGGFIGGLLAALVAVYNSMAFTSQKARKQQKIKPEYYMAIGLICVFISLIPSLLSGEAIMQGNWFALDNGFLGNLKLGTPLLFDIGVFFTVIGVTQLFLFTLSIKE